MELEQVVHRHLFEIFHNYGGSSCMYTAEEYEFELLPQSIPLYILDEHILDKTEKGRQ